MATDGLMGMNSILVDQRQRLGSHTQPRFSLSHVQIHLRQIGKSIRSSLLAPQSLSGGQALAHLRDPQLWLSLLGSCPAPQGRPSRQPVRKPLFPRQGYRRLSPLLGLWCLPALTTDRGHMAEGQSQTKGVRERPGQGHRLVDPLQRLVRIPQQPQSPGRIAQALYFLVLSVDGGESAMLLGIIEGNPLLEVRPGCGQLSTHQQRRPQCPVSRQEQSWVLDALGQPEALLLQLQRLLKLPTHKRKRPQSQQRLEELRRVSQLLA